MEILYEDKHIVVAIKPVGILSQADSGGKESMVSVLSDICHSDIYPLHRLDRDVSGVMVYGKTKLKGEKALLKACENAIVIRTAWLYSSFGNNYPRHSKGKAGSKL